MQVYTRGELTLQPIFWGQLLGLDQIVQEGADTSIYLDFMQCNPNTAKYFPFICPHGYKVHVRVKDF